MNRRDFIKAGALAAAAVGAPGCLNAALGGKNMKKIKITKGACNFEREPMVRYEAMYAKKN